MYKQKAFIDSHLHFLGMGYVAYLLDLKSCGSIDDIIRIGKTALNQSVIIGRGWNQEIFKEKRSLTKHDLNQISTEIPVVMIRACGHVLAVNDKMLELAKINSSYVHQGTGKVDYENGIIAEDALPLIYSSYPNPSKEELKKYLMKANEICLQNGITKVASDDFQIFPIPYDEIIKIIHECYEENLIQVAITEQVNLGTIELLQEFIDKGYVNQRFGRLRMGPLKLLSDGSLGGRTAALFEPYSDDLSNSGILTYTDSELSNLVHLADSNHMDVVIHAIGDRASDQAINAIINSLKITKREQHHHALIHAQMTTQKQIELMREWQIGAIVQPIFLNSDIAMIAKRIGSRKSESYLFHSMLKKGISVGFSTDSPIENVNPFENIYSAITRRSISDPSLPVFLENEAYSLQEAMDCYLEVNRKYINDSSSDDEIIIDALPNQYEIENLLKITVLETRIDGKTVYLKRK